MTHNPISEEDIDAAVRYMKIFHPEKADRTYCQVALERYKSGLFKASRNSPDFIEDIFAQNEAYNKGLGKDIPKTSA